jgi:hypothetical protein
MQSKKFDGLVRHIKKNGDKFTVFEGSYKNGEPSGYGRLIQENGDMIRGYWSKYDSSHLD